MHVRTEVIWQAMRAKISESTRVEKKKKKTPHVAVIEKILGCRLCFKALIDERVKPQSYGSSVKLAGVSLQYRGFLSAINDPAISVEYISYLLKFDSTHGQLKGNITHTCDRISVDGKGHLACDGVRRVIVTAPSVDVPMIILGVNENKLGIAPIIKVLEDSFGVAEGFITSIHALTPSLKPLDGLCLRGKHWRDHRSILQNIIPASTGACKALGKIIPELKDKLSGLAFRVPIVNVSVLDLTIRANCCRFSKMAEEAQGDPENLDF
ncbi:Multivalent antigen sj97-GAPDH [Operophtera brumata]|uniref:Multivalent antigen sj97-GAPDH n=1 Tax=Operophtera brumata TaxID=104452 RepID=A0A0L7LF00_OPEBR|nr:Multivalent antigen sj97-GAPDH [Operophtera brumata]